MAKIGRPGLSVEKKAELWERWKSGQGASDIARSLDQARDPPCLGVSWGHRARRRWKARSLGGLDSLDHPVGAH